ncbi:ATP-binding cassette domain-containing protein [Paenibacillus gansuensis]|uniref:ATP-binding cassette domain-containing protein n=1 Tax=Paenibacillus gansuensis TaxID=306542 RepID=A0ABW5PBJ8_9BACL
MIIRNLTKEIQHQPILTKISLEINEGEFVAVLGASGSGKTTFLKCLALREAWDEGQYIYEGKDISKAGWLEKLKLNKHWAFLEEKADVQPRKSALKNVLRGRLFHTPIWRLMTGRVSTEEYANAMDYLENVGLLDKASMAAEKLSGGERQRIALARGFVQRAKVIFADEPISGIDPAGAERVMQDFRYVCQRDKATVICTMHNAEFAQRYASRILGLAGGKIVVDVTGRPLTQREKSLIFE